MVNAGRVLIIPKGTWSNLQNYEMLDLVSLDGVAYLARAASVGQNPSTDTSMTYWQPFGTASEIATTSKPGLVMPDGQTITIDATGLIQANLGISDLNNVTITSIANGQILVYDSTAGAWKNANLSVSAGDVNYNNQTSGLTATKVQGAIDEVSSQMQTLATNQGTMSSLTTTDKTSLVNAVNEVNSGLSGKASSQSVTDLSTAVDNKHKVTRLWVSTSSWTQDTTSQSGTTLYKKDVALNHVYVTSPSVDIANANNAVLPSAAQQTDYDLVQYVTVDDTVPCLYIYASDIPTTGFWINVEGVD